jgi:N-acetylneuraminic acid mutarotase
VLAPEVDLETRHPAVLQELWIVDSRTSSAHATHSAPVGVGAGGDDTASMGSAHRELPAVTGRPIEAGGSNGPPIEHTGVGQWRDYPIHVPSTGSYVFSATVACPSTGARFHVLFDGVDLTGRLEIPKTADWLDWNTVASRLFRLPAGDHVMRLCLDRNATDSGAVGNFETLFVTPVRQDVALSWMPAAHAPAARFEGVGRAVGGKLYTFGGYTSVVPFGVSDRAAVYDPHTGRWTDLGAIPVPQTHCGVAVDAAMGRIYFLGGRRGIYPGTATDEVWRYDLATNAWTRLPPLPERLSAGAAEFLNGQVHYVGGNRGQDRTSDYDLHYAGSPARGDWHPAAPLPAARDHLSAVTLSGKLYVFGGETGHDAHHHQKTDAWAYDPRLDAWSPLAAMPIGKSHAESSTFVLNGRILIAGGQVDNWLATANVVEYDPAADAWAMLPPLPAPLEGVIVQPLAGRLFATGGYVGYNSVASVASYSSSPVSGSSHAPAGIALHAVLFGCALLTAACGLLALAAARRRRMAPAENVRSLPLAAHSARPERV